MSNCSPTDMAPWVAVSIDNAKYFTYKLLVYPYLLTGIFGHALFLYVCYKQSKTDSAFLYQAFLSTVRIFEIISFGLLTFAQNRWAGLIIAGGWTWYRQSYLLMFFAAHVSIPLVNGFINASLLITLLIIIDRLIAMSKPQFYRVTWQRAKYRAIAFACSLALGFALVLYDSVRLYVIYSDDEQMYVMLSDFVYQNSFAGIFFANLRNVALLLGVAALWTCNVAVVRTYRSKMMGSIGQQSDSVRSVAEIERETRRKAAERTLFTLMICQGTINGIALTSLAFWSSLAFGAPNWLRCMGVLKLWAPIDDAALQLAGIMDFYFPLLISKQLRRMVFPWCNKQTAIVMVAPASSTAATGVATASRLK